MLYAYLFGFFLFAGIIVGNDPVVLSGTAFLAYMTRVAGIVPPTAWINAQFIAANIGRAKHLPHTRCADSHFSASTVLVPSNPTNLVLSGGFGISFTTYTQNVVAPSIASALVVLPTLMWWYGSRSRNPAVRSERINSPSPRQGVHPEAVGDSTNPGEEESHTRHPIYIPRVLRTVDVPSPSLALVDPGGAIFGSVLLFVTLATLLAASAAKLKVQVWSVTVPAAVIMFCRDLWWDLRAHGSRPKPPSSPSLPRHSSDHVEHNTDGSTSTQRRPNLSQGELAQTYPPQTFNEGTYQTREIGGKFAAIQKFYQNAIGVWHRFNVKAPTVNTVLSRLPFLLVPFALSMFILVQALGNSWISVFASWWAAWVRKTGTTGAVFGMYIMTVLGCNVSFVKFLLER